MELSQGRTSAGDFPVVRVSGEVDMASADALRDEVLGLVPQHKLIVVDLTDVSFFDSTGLHALDNSQRQANSQDVRLALVCPQDRVLRLFEITTLDDLFSFHDSAEHAAEAFLAEHDR